ncbi:fimbrial protein [Siccibacter colletis]|uniref:fimbrial protein n=1 Tax=Siccibacter colletis TaxID=1505757 RepID=UPI0028BE3BDF|nr:fimbrial protein [Siccibacter colletis]WNN47059.1 fimbrial protein [Siccibacter colletis]
MKLKLISVITMVACNCLPVISHAADTTMTMTATVVASPCTVDSDSITKTIALDGGNGLQAKDLQTAGATSAWVDFDINLKDCPAGTTQAVMTFSGTADDDDAANYKNTGTAKNIAVQLNEKGSGNQLSNGIAWTRDITSGTAQYSMSARAYTKNGGTTPGTVQAVVTASFTYQ